MDSSLETNSSKDTSAGSSKESRKRTAKKKDESIENGVEEKVLKKTKKLKDESSANEDGSIDEQTNGQKKKKAKNFPLKINLQGKFKGKRQSLNETPNCAPILEEYAADFADNDISKSTPAKKGKKKAKNQTLTPPSDHVTVKQEPITPILKAKDSALEDSLVIGRQEFQWVINPIEIDTFMADNWEKKHLLIPRKDPSYYQKLISRQTIDQMLRENIVEYTKNIDITSYKDNVRETHNPDGRAIPGDVWNFYSDGCSIRILNPQTFMPSVYAMNVKLQEYFHCMVGTNVYLTPPNSQGFAPHYDDIEAFVLQIEGKKHWKLYNPRSDEEYLPRVSSENFDQDEIGEPIFEVILEPGDLLYFPRGCIHQAFTVPGHHSLHVTLSVYQKNSWIDLMEFMMQDALANAAAQDVDFRRGVPLNLHQHLGIVFNDSKTNERKLFIDKARELFETIFNEESLDVAADQLAKKFQHDALPPMLTEKEKAKTSFGCNFLFNGNGEIAPKECIKENTKVRLLRRNILRLVQEEGTIRVYYSTDNSKEYHEYEPNFLELEEDVANGIEDLVKAYPHFMKVKDISVENPVDFISSLWERGLLIYQ